MEVQSVVMRLGKRHEPDVASTIERKFAKDATKAVAVEIRIIGLDSQRNQVERQHREKDYKRERKYRARDSRNDRSRVFT